MPSEQSACHPKMELGDGGKALAAEFAGTDEAVLDIEDAGKAGDPVFVGDRDVLAGIGLDGGNTGYMGGEPSGVDEAGAGAGEVLHAEEHLVFLGDGGHEEGLCLAFAGLEGGAGIAHFAGKHEAFFFGEGFVDDDRLALGGFVHDVGAVGLEVTPGGLFDVLDAAVGAGAFGFDLIQHVEEVGDVWALFVEVKGVDPILALDGGHVFGAAGMDAEDAFDIPLGVLPVEFDFDVTQAVEADPLGEIFRQAVADRFLDIGGEDGIDGADEVIERHEGLGPGQHIAAQVFALELGADVVAEILAHAIGAVGLVGAAAEEFAVGVVDGGIEGADDDEGAELRDGLLPLLLTGKAGRGGEVLILESDVDVDGMTGGAGGVCDAFDFGGEQLHGVEGLLVAHELGGEAPDVAHGHGAEAALRAAETVLDDGVDVEHGDLVDDVAAELDWGAVEEVLVGGADLLDPDLDGLGARVDGEGKRSGEEAAAADRLRHETILWEPCGHGGCLKG